MSQSDISTALTLLHTLLQDMNLAGGKLARLSPDALADKTLAGLGLDSLSLLELVLRLEEQTGIEISVTDLHSETRLREMAAMISRSPAG